MYCDYFFWCVSCTMDLLTFFVVCGCVYVRVLYCVGVLKIVCLFSNYVYWYLLFFVLLYSVFLLFHLCILYSYLFCLY
jgi:hypothetical protein